MSNNDIGCRIAIPSIISATRPMFRWFDSSDPDSDSVTYELQVAPSGVWGGPGSGSSDGVVDTPGDLTEVECPIDIEPDMVYAWRVRSDDGYEDSEWSVPLAFFRPVSTSIPKDVGATIRVIPRSEIGARIAVRSNSDLGAHVFVRGMSDLGGSLSVVPHNDVGARLNINGGAVGLGGYIAIPTTSDMPASINVMRGLFATINILPKADIGASIDVYHILGASITIRHSAEDDSLGGRIGILTNSDVGGSAAIIPKSDMGGRISTFHGLQSSIFIIPKSNIGATVNVDVDYQRLGGSIHVRHMGTKDLGASVYIGQMTVDIGARICLPHKDLGASLEVFRGLFARIVIPASGGVSVGASLDVSSEWQQIGASMRIFSRNDISASANVDISPWIVGGSVNILRPGLIDIGARMDVDANFPDSVTDLSLHEIPCDPVASGVPSLPAGWMDGEMVVPPSGAVEIPAQTWQPKRRLMAVWTPPSGMGYGADWVKHEVSFSSTPSGSDTSGVVTIDENCLIHYREEVAQYHDIFSDAWSCEKVSISIRSVNSHGWKSPPVTTQAWFNVPPTQADPSGLENYGVFESPVQVHSPRIFVDPSTDPDESFLFSRLDGSSYVDDPSSERKPYDETIMYQTKARPSGQAGATMIGPSSSPSSAVIGGVDREYVRLPKRSAGIHEWAIRSTDGKEFSEWTDWRTVDVQPAVADAGARIWIGNPWLVGCGATLNVIQYRDVGARIFIRGVKDMGARIGVGGTSDLGGQIRTSPGSIINARINVGVFGNSDVGARCDVRTTSDIGGSITLQPSANMRAKITVSITHQMLYASLAVAHAGFSGPGASLCVVGVLRARMNVLASGNRDVSARTNIFFPASGDIASRIMVYPRSEIPASIHVIPRSDIFAVATIEGHHPSDVDIEATVLDSSWQTSADVDFTLSSTDEFYDIAGYHLEWDSDPDTEVDSGGYFLVGGSISKHAFDAGAYYLHAKAVNSEGVLSRNTSHFGFWYNHAPGKPADPLTVEGGSGGAIFTTRPEFEWGNSVDADSTDVVTYDLQVSKFGTYDVIEREINGIPQPPNSGRASFKISHADRLPDAGYRFWRVRGNDGRQGGQWADGGGFDLTRTTEDIGAEVGVAQSARSLAGASIFVVPMKELGARIRVTGMRESDLLCRIHIRDSGYAQIGAVARVLSRSEIGASVAMIPHKDLGAILRVTCVPGYADVGARARVMRHGYGELWATMLVMEREVSSVGSYIMIPPRSTVDATIVTYTPEHFGWIEEFSRNIGATIRIIRHGVLDLSGRLGCVADRPGAIVITASVPEAQWQEEEAVVFEWSSTFCTFLQVTGYYVSIDNSALTQASDSFQLNSSFTKTVDLEAMSGAGIYYFHAAAKAENGLWGPTAHYAVWYNHVPANPTTPMLVNNMDSLASTPVIAALSAVSLSWGQALDSDPRDAVSYRLQVSPNANMSVPAVDMEGISDFRKILHGGLIPNGLYYWRTRAWDGRQWSPGWSPVGSFRMNTPPAAPRSLYVY